VRKEIKKQASIIPTIITDTMILNMILDLIVKEVPLKKLRRVASVKINQILPGFSMQALVLSTLIMPSREILLLLKRKNLVKHLFNTLMK
jgi:hypothetical protein